MCVIQLRSIHLHSSTESHIQSIASVIAAITPTPKDDHWFSYIYKVIDWCALNVLKAKDKG